MKRIVIVLAVLLFISNGFTQFSLYLEHKIPVKSDRVESIQFSKGGRFLAFGDKSGNITVWDVGAGRRIHSLRSDKSTVNSLIFDSREQRLLSGTSGGKITIWDLYSGQSQNVIKDFRSAITSISLSPDDRFLAASGKKKEIYVWEFPLGTLKGKLKGHKKSVLGHAFHLAGDQILSVSEDKQMIVWNVNRLSIIRKTDIEARTMNRSGIDMKSAAFSFDRAFVGMGIQEHAMAKGGRRMIFKYNLSFFDWKTGSEIETLQGNRKDILISAISPDKNYVITDNSTLKHNQISFWNIQKGIIEHDYDIDGKITAMAISEDGKWLAVAYQNPNSAFQSFVNLWQLSGISGFERFATGSDVRSSGNTGFGASIKVTTSKEPLIQMGQRKRLAVLYFDSPGLEANVARTTSYLLESRLGNSPLVELIERNQIENVLSELQYQQMGLTTSNAVEVGQHLNAEYILLGSINKLGNLLIITAKLVNVETAQIEGSREVQCSNATIETISDMVSILAPTIAKY